MEINQPNKLDHSQDTRERENCHEEFAVNHAKLLELLRRNRAAIWQNYFVDLACSLIFASILLEFAVREETSQDWARCIFTLSLIVVIQAVTRFFMRIRLHKRWGSGDTVIETAEKLQKELQLESQLARNEFFVNILPLPLVILVFTVYAKSKTTIDLTEFLRTTSIVFVIFFMSMMLIYFLMKKASEDKYKTHQLELEGLLNSLCDASKELDGHFPALTSAAMVSTKVYFTLKICVILIFLGIIFYFFYYLTPFILSVLP